jgi:hypothetical protein
MKLLASRMPDAEAANCGSLPLIKAWRFACDSAVPTSRAGRRRSGKGDQAGAGAGFAGAGHGGADSTSAIETPRSRRGGASRLLPDLLPNSVARDGIRRDEAAGRMPGKRLNS